MSEPDAIDGWVEALGSDDRARRLEAHVELLRYGDAVVPALARLLADGPVLGRREAAWSLAHVLDGAHSVRPSIERAMRDEDAEVRRWAGEALRRLDDPGAAREAMLDTLAALTEHLGDEAGSGNVDSH